MLDLINITRDKLIEVSRRAFPRNAYRGEFRNANGEHVCNLYVVNHRVYLAESREYGHGEIAAMIPGNFDPKDFERAGGLQVYSTQYIKFWQFRPTVKRMSFRTVGEMHGYIRKHDQALYMPEFCRVPMPPNGQLERLLSIMA